MQRLNARLAPKYSGVLSVEITASVIERFTFYEANHLIGSV